MTDTELLDLAIEMRRAQNDYYRGGRSRDQLRTAKELEIRFDRQVKARSDAQRTLFGDDGPAVYPTAG